MICPMRDTNRASEADFRRRARRCPCTPPRATSLGERACRTPRRTCIFRKELPSCQLGDLVDYCRRNSGFASETDGATISACVNRADLPATRFTLPTSQHARQTPMSKPEQNPVHSPNEFTIARRCGDGKQMNGFDQGVSTLVCIVARAVMLPSDRRTTARMVGVLMDRPSDC